MSEHSPENEINRREATLLGLMLAELAALHRCPKPSRKVCRITAI